MNLPRVTLVLTVVLLFINASNGQKPKAIRIAMARTFLHDQPKVFIEIAVGEFKEVMKETTGLAGDLEVKLTAEEIAARIHSKQLDYGILYAHEFAWAQKKHPDLQPFLIAATKQKDKRAHLIVHQNFTGKSIAELGGKTLDLPSGTKEYCRIYLDKVANGQKFFASVAKSGSQFEALDQVARKKADATVIDTIWLDLYKELKGPVFAKNLKVLDQSAVVPPAVIVYKPGALPKATEDRIRAGLAKAHTTTRGIALMALWHIDAFEAVPKGYGKSLEIVLKEFPPPNSPQQK